MRKRPKKMCDLYDWVLFDLGGTLFQDLPPHYTEHNQRTLLDTLGANEWVKLPAAGKVFRQARKSTDRRFLSKTSYTHKSLVASHALAALIELGIAPPLDWETLDATRKTVDCSPNLKALAVAIDQYFLAQATSVVDNVRLQRGCHEMFGQLTGRYQMAVVSNNCDSYLLPLLQRYRLNRWLAGAYSSDSLGVCKPAPAIFERAFERLGIAAQDKHRVLYVGDSNQHDVAGALAAGLDVAWLAETPAIDGPQLTDTELTDAKPTYTVSSLPALADLLTS